MSFVFTPLELEQVIEGNVTSLNPLVISNFPRKEKRKYMLLTLIAPYFKKGLKYTETDINFILMPIHEDYVTIRRYLVDYGFLARTADGKAYWVPEALEEHV